MGKPKPFPSKICEWINNCSYYTTTPTQWNTTYTTTTTLCLPDMTDLISTSKTKSRRSTVPGRPSGTRGPLPDPNLTKTRAILAKQSLQQQFLAEYHVYIRICDAREKV